MGSFDSSRSTVLKPAQRSRALITSGINRLFLIVSLLVFFVFCPSFSQLVFAAPSSPVTKNVQNPEVAFVKGLLSVQAEDGGLKALMEGISQKAGIGVSINPALQEEKVTVQFNSRTID